MPEPDALRTEVSNESEQIQRLREALMRALERHGYGRSSSFAIRLAFEEAIANAFCHGHRHKPAEPVRVEWEVHERQVRLVVEDRGPGFDPDEVPDPTSDENLDKPCGRGLMLIRAYMTRVEHSERGNRVEMLYRKPPPATGGEGEPPEAGGG